MDIFGYSHLHTRYTDGDLSLSDVKKILLSQGASFAFITEHKEYFKVNKYEQLVVECQQLSDDKILFIPGLEIAAGRNHILVLGAKQCYDVDDLVSLFNKYKADGCLIIWAHPQRGHYQMDSNILNLIDGIEVWNSAYDTKLFPRFSSLSYAKKNIKNNWLLFCGLDFHRQSHLPGPKIFLTVNHLHSDELMQKLKTGDYQFGNQKRLNVADLFGKKYYVYFYASLFFVAILKTFKTINSVLSALNISLPVKIKNYLRKNI